MGANVSTASDDLRTIIESIINIQNSISNICASDVAQIAQQNFEIYDSKLKIDLIESKNYANFDSNCLLSSELDQSIKAVITQQANQIAEAINKGLGIGANVSSSKVTADLVTRLSEDIRNSITSTCKNSFIQSNSIGFKISGSDVTIGAIKLENSLNATTSCVMNNLEKSQNYMELKDIVDQSAKSKNSGLDLTSIFLIVGIIIAVFIGISFLSNTSSGKKAKTKVEQTQQLAPIQLGIK